MPLATTVHILFDLKCLNICVLFATFYNFHNFLFNTIKERKIHFDFLFAAWKQWNNNKFFSYFFFTMTLRVTLYCMQVFFFSSSLFISSLIISFYKLKWQNSWHVESFTFINIVKLITVFLFLHNHLRLWLILLNYVSQFHSISILSAHRNELIWFNKIVISFFVFISIFLHNNNDSLSLFFFFWVCECKTISKATV